MQNFFVQGKLSNLFFRTFLYDTKSGKLKEWIFAIAETSQNKLSLFLKKDHI